MVEVPVNEYVDRVVYSVDWVEVEEYPVDGITPVEDSSVLGR